MIRHTFFIVVFLGLKPIECSGQQARVERTSPLAVSGPVELYAIRIERQRVSRIVVDADLTNMQLSLWIDVEAERSRDFLVRIVQLDPIEDDLGKLLSTDKRLKDALPV